MFGLSLHILDLIEHFIQARVSALSVDVEWDHLNGVMKIQLKDSSPVFTDVSDEKKGGSLRNMKNSGRDIDLECLRNTAARYGSIFEIGKGELDETTVTGTVELDSIKGEIHRDLAVMLSSIVCTNPDLDLTFEFRADERKCSMRVSEIKNKLPSEKSGGSCTIRLS